MKIPKLGRLPTVSDLRTGARSLPARARALFQRIIPPARAPLTLRVALPILLFLLVFAGLIIGLEATRTMTFARPWMFCLIAVAPWFWWMQWTGYGGLPPRRRLASLLLRLVLVGTFVMLLAEPRSVRTNDVLSVIYAVDYSDSIGDDAAGAALEFVTRTVSEKPGKDEAGLIVFARTAGVELPPSNSFPFDDRSINSRIDRDATNLEQTLSLSAALVPEENQGRIVLISDGTQTEGSLARVLDELKSRGISVDVLPVQYQYQDEVWLERLDLPRFVKLGEDYEATVVLSSLKAGKGRLVLKENGETIAEQDVEFQAGKNQYVIPLTLRAPGYYEYAATISVAPGADHLMQNNTVLNYIYVEGEGKALIVIDPVGDERDWQSLVQAIKEGERAVEVIPANTFPRDALSLMPYDAIVFVNVAADAFDPLQMQAVKDAVYDLGVGFLMVGGANSFGPGGYHRTAVEDALPVSMDISQKKVLPKGALVIILHTCEFPSGNTWAKRVTKRAIEVLGGQDEAGVIIYGGGGEEWVFRLTPASEFATLVPKINGADPGDMPSFTTTMTMGLAELKASDAAVKHMIIISDGDPSPPPPTVVQDYIDSKISISMVAIFPHGGQDISVMQSIAQTTGGRYYHPQDPSLLPAIFVKESKTLKRTMIQNKTVQPEREMPSSILKGIDSIPPLKGYVLVSPKEKLTTTILKVPDQQDQVDPILATWKFGLGTTAAFTSDLSPNWGVDWVSWEKYQAFVKQLMTNISRIRQEGQLRMWTYTAGNQGVILVEDFAPEAEFLDVKARISGPRDQSETVTLKQIGPRRYQAIIPLWGKGRYQVMAAGSAGTRTDRALDGFIVPYSPEYLRFRSNPIALKEIAERTGGMVLDPDSPGKDIFETRRTPKQSTSPVLDWFLVMLAILIPIDVAIRRIQLDFSFLRNWGKSNPSPAGPSTPTMAGLRQRKQAVGAKLQSQSRGTPPAVPPPTKVPPPTSGPPNPPDKPATPDAPDTTTGRLLERKRRRKQEPE